MAIGLGLIGYQLRRRTPIAAFVRSRFQFAIPAADAAGYQIDFADPILDIIAPRKVDGAAEENTMITSNEQGLANHQFGPTISQSAKALMVAVGVGLCFYGGVVAAVEGPNLDIYVAGQIHSSGLGAIGPFIQTQDVLAGPLSANVVAGAVLKYSAPGFEDFSLETTLTARSQATADYGTNSAAIKSQLAATNGTDRGIYLSGPLTGSLGAFGFGLPVSMDAHSSWTDSFVIQGGSGLGSATVNVDLSGTVSSGYGENGNGFYSESGGVFEAFGTKGYGFLNYGMDVRYDVDPIDFGGDGAPAVLRVDQSFSAPLPLSGGLGIPTDMLTGSFLFQYNVPFSLTSFLGLSGYHQIDMDYSNTATLSSFGIPDGATLISGSGHSYQVAAVPEPEVYAMMAVGLAMMGFVSRRRKQRAAAA